MAIRKNYTVAVENWGASCVVVRVMVQFGSKTALVFAVVFILAGAYYCIIIVPINYCCAVGSEAGKLTAGEGRFEIS